MMKKRGLKGHDSGDTQAARRAEIGPVGCLENKYSSTGNYIQAMFAIHER